MADNPREPVSVSDEAGSFAYRATGPAGQSVSGTLDAPTIAAARQRLVELGLHASEIKPTGKPRVRWPLSGDDFLAFNQQIAQLTAAGMPVEFGLRLIARDMRRGRLAAAIESVADDLESGKSLPEAIAAHRSSFPPLYGPLVEAGISAGKLSAVLMNLSVHMAFVQRMRSAMWRALSYPAIVLVMLTAVFFLICGVVLPPLERMTTEVYLHNSQNVSPYGLGGYQRSTISQIVFAVGDVVRSPGFMILAAVVCAAVIALFLWMRWSMTGRAAGERLAVTVPIIGRPLRMSLAARWCSAAALGIDAGLDLSRAVELAGAAVGSVDVTRDSQAMRKVLDAGGQLSGNYRLRVLPTTIPAAIHMASATGNLSETLQTLAQLYEHQAQATVEGLRIYLGVILMLLAGALVTLALLVVVVPVFDLISAIGRF